MSDTKINSSTSDYLREIKETQPVQTDVPEVDVQEDWIRFDFTNASSFERTSPVYCNVDGTIIEGKTWARILVSIVEHEISIDNFVLEALCQKSLYSNKSDKPFLMNKKIDGQNCYKLSNGYWINVNWNIPRLMQIIHTFCQYCGYQKQQIVLYGVPKGNISAKHDRSSPKKIIDRTFDVERVKTFLRDADPRGVTVQELIDTVQPEASFRHMKNALDDDQAVIAMPDDRYTHVDSLVDLDEAEKVIGRILSTHFAQFDGYSNNQLLFGAASQELSMFLNDNDCENIDAVYAIARYLFEKKASAGKQYKFYPPHIFEVEPDYPKNLKGLMINLARRNGGILKTVDARNFLQRIMLTFRNMGQLLQIGKDSTFLMYDDDSYLLSEAVGVDEEWCHSIHECSAKSPQNPFEAKIEPDLPTPNPKRSHFLRF